MCAGSTAGAVLQDERECVGAGVDGARPAVGRAAPRAGRRRQQQGPLAARAHRRPAVPGPREEDRYATPLTLI